MYSAAEIIDLAIKLSVCRNEHYYNVSAFRELNSMVLIDGARSDCNFLKVIECFSSASRATGALILCRVNDEVIVSWAWSDFIRQSYQS